MFLNFEMSVTSPNIIIAKKKMVFLQFSDMEWLSCSSRDNKWTKILSGTECEQCTDLASTIATKDYTIWYRQ